MSLTNDCEDLIPATECVKYLKLADYQCTKMPSEQQKMCERTCHLCKHNPEKSKGTGIEIDNGQTGESESISDSITTEKINLGIDPTRPIGQNYKPTTTAPNPYTYNTILVQDTNQKMKSEIERNKSSTNINSSSWPELDINGQTGTAIALWLVIVIVIAIVILFIIISYCAFKCHTFYLNYKHKKEMRELHRELTRNIELGLTSGASTVNRVNALANASANASNNNSSNKGKNKDYSPSETVKKSILDNGQCNSLAPINENNNERNGTFRKSKFDNTHRQSNINRGLPRHLSLRLQNSNLSHAHRTLIEQLSRQAIRSSEHKKQPLEMMESGLTEFLNDWKQTIHNQQLSLESQYEHINTVLNDIRNQYQNKALSIEDVSGNKVEKETEVYGIDKIKKNENFKKEKDHEKGAESENPKIPSIKEIKIINESDSEDKPIPSHQGSNKSHPAKSSSKSSQNKQKPNWSKNESPPPGANIIMQRLSLNLNKDSFGKRKVSDDLKVTDLSEVVSGAEALARLEKKRVDNL